MQRFWFLVMHADDTPMTPVTSVFVEAEDVNTLRKAVFVEVSRKLPAEVDAPNLVVFANHTAFNAKQALAADAPIHSLGVSHDDVLIVQVQVPLKGAAIKAYGMDPQAPCLSREELLERVYKRVMAPQNRFLLLIAPPGSGKTSLMLQFAHRYRHLNCLHVSLAVSAVAAAESSLKHGRIDVTSGASSLSSSQDHVVMIYDAQQQYGDRTFWSLLLKTAAKLPSVRFIISTRHAVDSPVELQSLPRLGREDFLVSDDEAHAFWMLPAPVGLPEPMRTPTLMQLIIRACNGQVGAVRMSINAITWHFPRRRVHQSPK